MKDKILDAAANLFFTHGYGATSIESVARQAHISKRTFYDRFRDKPDLFRAVMQRLVDQLSVTVSPGIFEGKDIGDVLRGLAKAVLRAALKPETLALNRLILAEATRFPELALAVNEQGARRHAVQRIAELLKKETADRRLHFPDTVFAAEQFLQMVTGTPQRRAFGLGKPMTSRELDAWANDTVELFLNGGRG